MIRLHSQSIRPRKSEPEETLIAVRLKEAFERAKARKKSEPAE